MKDHKLIAFGLDIKSTFKWFFSANEHLENLKDKIRNKVMFSRVIDFYVPKNIIGTGVSSQVYRFLYYSLRYILLLV
jgi:hypothetical protein